MLPVPTGLREITPLPRPECADMTTEPPQLTWVSVSALRVDESYQRGLSKRSRHLIGKIAAEWSWHKVKALSVAPLPGGLFEVIDGQHTATAAATRGDIDQLPCLVSSDCIGSARPRAFVGINQGRLNMTSVQVFWAEVAARGEVALGILNAVGNGGGEVLKAVQSGGYAAGETVAVGALREVYLAEGGDRLLQIVRVAVAAGLAPLSAKFVKALRIIMFSSEYRGELSHAQIAETIKRVGVDRLEDTADLGRIDTGLPVTQCLAVAIYRAAKS